MPLGKYGSTVSIKLDGLDGSNTYKLDDLLSQHSSAWQVKSRKEGSQKLDPVHDNGPSKQTGYNISSKPRMPKAWHPLSPALLQAQTP